MTSPGSRPSHELRTRLAAYAGLLAVAGAVVVTFLPGSFNADTLDMCHQAVVDRYTDFHSPIIAGIWGFFDVPPEWIFGLTTVLFVLGTYGVLRATLSRPWAAIAAAIVTLSPFTLGWLSFVDKDVWLATALLVCMSFLIKARALPPGSPARRAGLALAAVALWFAVASRQTAPISAFVVVLVLWPLPERLLALRRESRVLAVARRAALSAALVLLVLASQLLFNRVVVQPDRTLLAQGAIGVDLAALSIRVDEMLLPPAALAPGTTLDTLRANYQVETGDQLYFANPPQLVLMGSQSAVDDLRDRWLDAIRAHPVAYAKQKVKFGMALLGVSRPTFGVYGGRGSQPEEFGLRCPLDPTYEEGLWEVAHRQLVKVENNGFGRPWIFALLGVGVLALAAVRREQVTAALVLSGFASTVVFFALSSSATFRYLWMMVVFVSIALLGSLGRWPRFARADEHGGPAQPTSSSRPGASPPGDPGADRRTTA
ncbi:MAG: hypothetical protein AB7H43_15255 [Acidimicrobiia bacterium]